MCVDQRTHSRISTLRSALVHSLPLHSLPLYSLAFHSLPLYSLPLHSLPNHLRVASGIVESFSSGLGIGLADCAEFGDTEVVPMGSGGWM